MYDHEIVREEAVFCSHLAAILFGVFFAALKSSMDLYIMLRLDVPLSAAEHAAGRSPISGSLSFPECML